MAGDRFRIGPQVMARQIGDETVILDLASGLYFGLDEVGTRVWEMLAAGDSLEAICDTLAGEYEVPRETLCQDVRALVLELQSRRLLDAGC